MSNKAKTEGINDFLEKYKQAKGFNAKELRLTLAEAERLSVGIAVLLHQYQQLADEVIELQRRLLEPEEVVMSGGDFR